VIRILSIVVGAILSITLVGAVASAQPRRDPAHRRDQIKRKIQALRAATLTSELGLDDRALARVLPVLAKFDNVTEALVRERIEIHRHLRTAGGAKPRDVDRLIDKAIANQKSFWRLEEQRLAELRRILTPKQTARLLIVLPRFERRIQNQLRRALANGARRRQGTGAPVDPYDDDDGDDGFPR